MARLLAARGIDDADELSRDLRGSRHPGHERPRRRPPPCSPTRSARASAGAGRRRLRLRRCDGLRGRGARPARPGRLRRVDYLVPNRFEHGYGLTRRSSTLAARTPAPGTNRLADRHRGQRHREPRRRGAAQRTWHRGDRHRSPPARRRPLPAGRRRSSIPTSPAARFASKHLAGVGVMFYLLLALARRTATPGRLRCARRARACSRLLDLVALGTVADLVRLDANNRLLVSAGLRRIRAGPRTPA